MKLAQDQVWKQGDEYLRIVRLERLEVQYKAIKNLLAGEGTHHHVSKKEFCRLIKGATLLTQAEVRQIWLQLGEGSCKPSAIGLSKAHDSGDGTGQTD